MDDERTTQADWLERVRSTWDERAPSWDECSQANAAAPDRATDLARIAAALQLRPGSRLLDAGCGSGQFAVAFARLGCQVTGVDLAPAMIERARARAAAAGVEIAWRIGDIARLPEPLAVYDAIHARVVLQFLQDPVAALRELRRVLKPGGRLLASVPGALSPIYGRSWRRFLEPAEGVTYLVPWELEELLAVTGWSVIDEWSEFGANATGDSNPLSAGDVAALSRRLRQAAATTHTFIAR